MNILGIETSCDETAAAVVETGGRVLSNIVYSQVARHQPYGGVVPEIASRAHTEHLPGLIREALAAAGTDWDGIDRIAVTSRPGLASSLLIGVVAAKGLARRTGKPLVSVNHLAGHLVSAFMESPEAPDDWPALILLVSGGHTSLLLASSAREHRLLGQTIDDAAGEALDKGAKLLNLGYPGGPAMEKAAAGGDPAFVRFPRGEVQRGSGALDPAFCFSFSGLKTALLYYLKDRPETLTDGSLKHVAASYQEAVVDALAGRVERAAERFAVRTLACGGGVARNRQLRERLHALAARHGRQVKIAAPAYCTDNAAMIATAAAWGLGEVLDDPAGLDVRPTAPLGLPAAPVSIP